MLHKHTELSPKHCTHAARNKEAEHIDTNLMEMLKETVHIYRKVLVPEA